MTDETQRTHKIEPIRRRYLRRWIRLAYVTLAIFILCGIFFSNRDHVLLGFGRFDPNMPSKEARRIEQEATEKFRQSKFNRLADGLDKFDKLRKIVKQQHLFYQKAHEIPELMGEHPDRFFQARPVLPNSVGEWSCGNHNVVIRDFHSNVRMPWEEGRFRCASYGHWQFRTSSGTTISYSLV